MDSDQKLSLILEAADQSGFTVDFLLELSKGLNANAVAILLGNVSKLPKYMKSNEIPYLSLSRIAPSSDTRKLPLSH